MALAELQRALATLYTDEPSRERFARDPSAFANRFALSDAERLQLFEVGTTRLHAYADGLDRKRANEAARALPVSARALGPAFRRTFLQYARGSPLAAGAARYRDDAIAFARRCGAHPLVAFEGASLERARAGAPFARVAIFAIDVRATLRTARVVHGRTLVVWFARRSEPLMVRMPSAVRNAPPDPAGPDQR